MLEDFLNPSFMYPYRQTGYIRPWRSTTARGSGLSSISTDNDEFKVNLDVQQFRPEEVTVKTVDNYVIVNGKHEERPDEHGYVCRSFQRRYLLPKNIDQDAIKSTLSTDGVLSIVAPKLAAESKASERPIPIVQTNVPAIASGTASGTDSGTASGTASETASETSSGTDSGTASGKPKPAVISGAIKAKPTDE